MCKIGLKVRIKITYLTSTRWDKTDNLNGHIVRAKGKLETYWLKVIKQTVKGTYYGAKGKSETYWLKVIK